MSSRPRVFAGPRTFGRTAALLLVGLATPSASGLALADSVAPAEPPPTRAELRLVTPLRGWPPPPEMLPPKAVHPVKGSVGYGEGGARYGADRGGREHEGQDVFAPAGTPLVAVRDGVVLPPEGSDGGRGHYVGIYSPDADETYVYLHLLEPASVEPGEEVAVGERIGKLGCSGSCFGDHLHFEVRRGKGYQGEHRDPMPLLERWARRR